MQEDARHMICLFGPQGSGKGTQAERLSAWLGIPQISPGNIFRKAIADRSELGRTVEEVITSGRLVPDRITNTLMRERIAQEDCIDGFIFDGFPRNTVQADAMDAMTRLSHVIVIDIPQEESVSRISQRRVCPQCGITYHLQYKPSHTPNICDVCGNPLIHRDDDQPEAILERLRIYRSETEPLVSRYESQGIVYRINGLGSIEDIWKRVQGCIDRDE